MNQKNTLINQVTRVEKMKQTKLRNREIKELTKNAKNNAELKAKLIVLQNEKNKYVEENKKLIKEKAKLVNEKVALKKREEKYNYYNKMPLKKQDKKE
jgi:hypothetical protein